MSNISSANNSTSDPREQLCWDIYVEKISQGITNAYQSAVEAGYSTSHAENITLQGWFKERLAKLKRRDMLSKAERNLDKILDFKMEDQEGRVNTPVASLVSDVSKVIVKSLGKNEGYSDRTELTGKDGAELPTPIYGGKSIEIQRHDSNKENLSTEKED